MTKKKSFTYMQTEINFWMAIRTENTPAAMARRMRELYMKDVAPKLYLRGGHDMRVVGEVTFAMANLATRVEKACDKETALKAISFFRAVDQI